MTRGSLSVIAFLLMAVGVFGAPPQRRSWEWTDEERIAVRTDPTAQRARVAETIAATKIADSVIGSSHPELLLPTEVFTVFMRNAYAHDDDVAVAFREHAQERIVEIALPADLLATLEAEASEFIVLQSREEDLRKQLSSSTDETSIFTRIQELEREQSPIRANVIARMRKQYGKESFDRFLYDVVAPGVS